MKSLRIKNSNGVLKRQIDVDDTTGHLFVYDENELEIMDFENHASRHASGGADELPAGSISNSMLQSGAVTSDKAAEKSNFILNSVSTGVAIGVNGSPAEILSLSVASGYNNAIPMTVKGTPSGLGTAESCIYHLVATLSDGSEVTLATKSGTAEVVITLADCDFTVVPSGERIVKLTLTAESSATTTSATSTGVISAMENYI